MILSLYIKNFALIEKATIEFGEGLNIISGETGAGKSIFIKALEFLLGDRVSADVIRQGSEEAEVSGLFQIQDREISLRRVLHISGRSRAFINERPVNIGSLEEMGFDLMDLVGQHEHQVLLKPEKHLSLLDDCLDPESLKNYQTQFQRYYQLMAEIADLQSKADQAKEREDFLKFQFQELAESHVEVGEEERLKTDRDILKYGVRLGDGCHKSLEALEDSESSTIIILSKVIKELEGLVVIDPSLTALKASLENSLCQVQDVVQSLRRYAKKISFDPEALEKIENRLALVSKLRKKYGGTEESLLAKQKEIQDSLALIDHCDEALRDKRKKLEESEDAMVKAAQKLSVMRQSKAKDLSFEIEKELGSLWMKTVQFQVYLIPLQKSRFVVQGRFFNEQGAETCELLMAPNPGEGLKPLAKMASGGEVSRVFLAIKTAISRTMILKKFKGISEESSEEVSEKSTLVFDEIDTGVGGAIAEAIGQKLSLFGEQRQVICVTHLPQVACYADHHFIIQKETEKGRTYTHVKKLETEEREEEIARMLAGMKITKQAMAHARELIREARK